MDWRGRWPKTTAAHHIGQEPTQGRDARGTLMKPRFTIGFSTPVTRSFHHGTSTE
jgi:hypothetical protein